MKIGVLTFHNAHNYGAVLQAYALKTALNKMGHNAKIINYRNSVLESRYSKDLRSSMSIRAIRGIKSFVEYIKMQKEHRYAQNSWTKQWEGFEQFIDENLLEKENIQVSLGDISRMKFDVFIVGSDQVWTEWITGGLDKVYFLDFETQAKKISYAASMGIIEFKEGQREYFKKVLNDFSFVTVRERKTKETLENLLEREVYEVLDPTLLLKSEDYQKIEKKIDINKEYILAYFIVEDQTMMKYAQILSFKLGLELLEIHYFDSLTLQGHNVLAELSPGEFLTYFKNASYVITNSYHGTIFAVVYHKQFYSFYTNDLRKNNLLEKLSLTARHIYREEFIGNDELIDYSKVDLCLDKLRRESMELLNIMLKCQEIE